MQLEPQFDARRHTKSTRHLKALSYSLERDRLAKMIEAKSTQQSKLEKKLNMVL